LRESARESVARQDRRPMTVTHYLTMLVAVVATSLAKTASIGNEPMGAELGALWLGLVNTFGRW